MRVKSLLLIIVLLSCNSTPPGKTPQSTPAIFIDEKPTDESTSSFVAKNIILLIGDGMGLSQISGGMYMNGNKTALEKFPVVGLHKAHSSNNLITDSAASATAFACGVKTYNGAIGVDKLGSRVGSILEEAEAKGLATGLVATSTIVHATPAAFIAHTKDRRNYEEIALDFLNTDIDLFIGGGKQFFTRRKDSRDLYIDLRKNGYYVTDYFETKMKHLEIPPGKKLAYFTSDADPLPVSRGRDYLIPATKLTLEFLSNQSDKGFFVMIEGSQIDWGGHANDRDYVISEFIEFDKVINLAINFAKKNGETLVIVTADHETGGFLLLQEVTQPP
jgi:alkaline phosphatase